MKYIFDYDDVLFQTSKHRNERTVAVLGRAGISPEMFQEYYEKERWNLFSFRKMLAHFSLPENLYEEIMGDVKDFRNDNLLHLIEHLGKDNCFIVTYGEHELQMDKISRVEISHLFQKIIVVQGSKKEAVEQICAAYPDETIYFIDDKEKHFEDLDFKKYPNLKTILYAGQDLENILR